MLILTRKKEQQIVISDDIVITIVDIGNDKVRIGIDAPKSVSVVRRELIEDTKKINHESCDVSANALKLLKSKLKKN